MNCKTLVLVIWLSFSGVTNAGETEVYEGDQRLACEALLCLTVGWGLSECQPSIRKFFSFWSWNPSELLNKRMGFLGLCSGGMSDADRSLIVNHAGHCQGARFDRYVSGYRSYTFVETERGGSVRASCSWNDKVGVWGHSRSQSACVTSLSPSQRLARAERDCAAFRNRFSLE